jgi:hypothetical protein
VNIPLLVFPEALISFVVIANVGGLFWGGDCSPKIPKTNINANPKTRAPYLAAFLNSSRFCLDADLDGETLLTTDTSDTVFMGNTAN